VDGVDGIYGARAGEPKPVGEDPKTLIRQQAGDLGIDGLGFCDAGPLDGVAASIEQAVRAGFIPPDLAPARSTLERFTTPARHLRGARSVVSAYEAYPTPPAGERPPVDPLAGTVAHYSTSNHYEDLRSRLRRLAAFIGERFGGRTKAFSCYVTLAEKPLARKAGLGFYGKHGVIVTPRHGSFVVLGEILTDLELEPDVPLERDCGTCRKCIEACPTGAIKTPYFVDRNVCIQALTGRRAEIPPAVRDVWGNRFHGCTDCQDACPYNKKAEHVERIVERGRVGPYVLLSEILLIGEAEFARRFGESQIGTRERNVIRRNAVIAAGNSRSPAFEEALVTCAQDPDRVVRQHALWALWRIKGREAASLLARALQGETDPHVAKEIKSLLDATGAVE
jgi:epoxyqueuosine reductase